MNVNTRNIRDAYPNKGSVSTYCAAAHTSIITLCDEVDRQRGRIKELEMLLHPSSQSDESCSPEFKAALHKAFDAGIELIHAAIDRACEQ